MNLAILIIFSFQGIVNRIWRYHYSVDIILVVVSSIIHLLYLIVTFLVEFCAGPGKHLNSPFCNTVLDSSSVYLLYQSSTFFFYI
jgi:hypothetical protein